MNLLHIRTSLLITFIGGILLWGCLGLTSQTVSKDMIWEEVKKQANKHDLDPEFVYAVAFAESSLRPNADSGKARGIMQLTEPAWNMVTEQSYHNAWDWKKNIEQGTAYLALNRNWLNEQTTFDYSLLAAAYRHGFTHLKNLSFDVRALDPPTNLIYKELFVGNIPILPKG